jgi:CRP-like cAMP-binding protein
MRASDAIAGSTTSGSPSTLKLEAFTRLSADDRAAIESLSRNVKTVEARRDLVKEGDRPKNVHLMLKGWAARYKDLPNGKRQIVGLFVPGDFCGLNFYILKRMDHSIGAITPSTLAVISPDEMDALTSRHSRITQALLWHQLVSASIEREWLLNNGQRGAQERLAHLLLEMYFRLRTVGLVRDGSCDFPLTQTDLAEVTGLTPVHVNRMVQELRRQGYIELERKRLHIREIDRLIELAMFNPDYLYLDHQGRHLNANA